MKNYFDKKQIQMLEKIGIEIKPIDEYSEDECVDMEEKVVDYLLMYCFDKDYVANEEGVICESLIDDIPNH